MIDYLETVFLIFWISILAFISFKAGEHHGKTTERLKQKLSEDGK